MPICRVLLVATFMVGISTFVICARAASPPAKLSEVVSVDDLEGEVLAIVSELDQVLNSSDPSQAVSGKQRRSAVQLAIFAQGLTEHDHESKYKRVGSAIRDAALKLSQSKTNTDALNNFIAMKQAMEASAPTIDEPAKQQYDWSQLAGVRLLMDAMRDRADLVRKGLRRSKDADFESRQASMMAILALAIEAHAATRGSQDQPLWNSTSRDVQRSMTIAAQAIRSGDKETALKHFTAAHDACDRCHEKFKH